MKWNMSRGSGGDMFSVSRTASSTLSLGLRTHLLIVGFVPKACFLHIHAEALDGIFLFPPLHFFAAPVTGGVISGGVIAKTVSDALDQRRPFASRARQCLVGGAVDSKNIIAIDLQSWKTVGNCLLRQRFGCRLSFRGTEIAHWLF